MNTKRGDLHKEQIIVNLSPELKARLREAAYEQDRSMASLVRKILFDTMYEDGYEFPADSSHKKFTPPPHFNKNPDPIHYI